MQEGKEKDIPPYEWNLQYEWQLISREIHGESTIQYSKVEHIEGVQCARGVSVEIELKMD